MPQSSSALHAPASRDGDGWKIALPLGFVMLALVALVALPFVGERRIAALREELRGAADVGRGLVTTIHVALAVQGSTLHDYVETRDPALVERYRQAASQEQDAYSRLVPVAARLGPPVPERLADLQRLQQQWHDRVARDIGRGEAPVARDSLREQLYDDLLTAAAVLDQAMSDASERRRQRIEGAERMQRSLAATLAVIALPALAVVAWLGRRLRASLAEAERRRVELERAMESRARLMRGLSHDLKNPLNAIDGHAQLLEDEIKGPLGRRQKESVARIRRSVRSLLALIDDLLELSRVEAGQLAVDPRPTPVADLVRECVEEHRAAAEAAGHRLDVAVADDLPAVVTDPARVRQVLGNLLSNAVKYTPSGAPITVRARTRDGRDGKRWTTVDVVDAGPGIPADQLETIFEEFSRLSVHKEKPGSGLGLAIARRISRLLGGDVTVASEVGKGSTFTLWLPLGEGRGPGVEARDHARHASAAERIPPYQTQPLDPRPPTLDPHP